ncbi:MAG: hypothetical protein LDLANPLL_02667 [Turneriella sp.]|nr:hypothetical protein [Turneriella sp.]
MKKQLFFFLFLFPLLAAVYATSGVTYIRSLANSDPELQKLRKEVTENLRTLADGHVPQVKWRRYRVKKNDTFFSIMARTVLNHDTISSVNHLASLWDVSTGDEWLLPNVRGIAAKGSRDIVAKKFGKKADSLVPIPGQKNYFFITGLHFESIESAFFDLRAFIRPVAGRLTSAFGMRRDPFTEKRKFHKGIDIGVPVGTPVVASADGVVTFVGKKGGYGNTVLVRHRNGYLTLYGHLSKFAVKKGVRVKQGQKIAYSGKTGRATGPHVHFEVRREGRAERPDFHRTQI